MNLKKGIEAVFEIYRRQFKEATPSVDFDKLYKEKKTTVPNWFMKYYLPMERQIEIFEEVCEEMKIKGWLKKQVKMEVCLGCSPNSSEKTWKEEMNTLIV